MQPQKERRFMVTLFSLYEEGFNTLHKNKMSQVYIVEEAVIGIEALLYAYRFGSLNAEMTDDELAAAADGLKSKVGRSL